MASGGHFGCSKFTFGRISRHFRSIHKLFCWSIFVQIDRDLPLIVGQGLYKIWSWSVHFGLSYGVHKLFHHIFTKWPLAAILVVRFSPKSIGLFHSRSTMAVKYQFDMSIGVAVTWTQALACGSGCGDGVQTKHHNFPDISNFLCYYMTNKTYITLAPSITELITHYRYSTYTW